LASRSPYVSARNSQPVTAPEIPTIHHPRSYIPGLVNIEKTMENPSLITTVFTHIHGVLMGYMLVI
jgi:hypothetical protein